MRFCGRDRADLVGGLAVAEPGLRMGRRDRAPGSRRAARRCAACAAGVATARGRAARSRRAGRSAPASARRDSTRRDASPGGRRRSSRRGRALASTARATPRLAAKPERVSASRAGEQRGADAAGREIVGGAVDQPLRARCRRSPCRDVRRRRARGAPRARRPGRRTPRGERVDDPDRIDRARRPGERPHRASASARGVRHQRQRLALRARDRRSDRVSWPTPTMTGRRVGHRGLLAARGRRAQVAARRRQRLPRLI